MPLPKDWREFIECLNSNKVEYVIVGALAVAWHGFPRFSADVDFLVRPSKENAERVVAALRAFGMGSLGLSVSDFETPGKVVQMGFEPNRIDVMTSLTGVAFEEVWESRIEAAIDGIPIRVIGKSALLRNKESTNRPKDRIDAEQLRHIKRD